MEKETLEEAAENYFKEKELSGYTYEVKDGFLAGAKWQQERMPADILRRIISFGDASPELMDTSFIEIYDKSKRWLEQFKKK